MVKTKTKMRCTSLSAFADIIESLGEKELIVLQAIKRLQPCSDKMIAKELGWTINRVTGRRNSLAKYKTIIIYKKDIDKVPPYKKVIFWIIPNWINGVMQ